MQSSWLGIASHYNSFLCDGEAHRTTSHYILLLTHKNDAEEKERQGNYEILSGF